MNLTEAHDLIDLLLDKADQPYFTTSEKNKFLDLAISDFINMHYQKMTVDEDSRRALSGCIDYISFSLKDSEIFVPWNLSAKYPSGWGGTAGDKIGYFTADNQYVVPKRHLYTLSIGVTYYNRSELIGSDGSVLPGASESYIVKEKSVNLKNKSTRDFYEDNRSEDPFNGRKIQLNSWAYMENKILMSRRQEIFSVDFQFILLPTVNEAFRTDIPQYVPRFEEHYQKQIIELTVSKMTKVDRGLMTPSSR